MKEFDKHAKVSASLVHRRFGGWQSAFIKAGLGERVNTNTRFKRGYVKHTYTNEQMITEIQRVSSLLNSDVITMEEYGKNATVIHPETIRRRFTSWGKAVVAAGLKISSLGKRHTDEDYFENLLTVWTYYGRQPTYGEMDKPPSRISAKAYEAKWKKWTNALIAFIDRVNHDEITDNKSAGANTPDKNVITKHNVKIKRIPIHKSEDDETRAIRIGIRYDVLKRDNFKCVICGATPANDVNCLLHVDHIIPYSKGGKNTLDNLRTLCSKCNIGRSNKV